jgi:hypothetical protein
MAKAPTTSVTRKNARRTVAGKTATATGSATTSTEASVTQPAAPSEADVALRAYQLYLDEGRPDGRHLEHWLRAEAELTAGRA